MNAERWQKIKPLFDRSVKLTPARRDEFLEKACAGDVELRQEIENLLSSFDDAGDFMDEPAAAEFAEMIVERNAKIRSGERIAHYEILHQIGAGGMGEVYLAKDTSLNRKVALKVLPANLTSDRARLQRFIQEAQTASALNHPNIITIYEIREYDEAHLIATEFVEGETLRETMTRKSLNSNEILDVFIQIASALSVAHSAGVVHRDIKPENVMLRPDGIVKLLDFGLAKLAEKDELDFTTASIEKLTAPGMVMGTINYMSPEQAQGASVDRRTDLWSLGVCLYETLAGNLPFSGKTINHTLVAIMENDPQPLSQSNRFIPQKLIEIVEKLLAKEPKHRYQTANALLEDLRDMRRNFEVKAPTEEPTIAFSAQSKKAESEQAISSIAVLPFSSVGLSDDEEYLSLGLADALITQLSRTKQLAVRPTSAVRGFANTNRSVSFIGQALRVNSILEGNLQRAGERMRVTVQLVDTSSETSLWAEKFLFNFTDIFEVQDEIALRVSKALLTNFTSDQHQKLIVRGTNNIEAYQTYLKARFYLHRTEPGSLPKAISLFRQVIELAPEYAEAHAGLAESYIFSSYLAAPHEALSKARESAERAIELDENSAEAHVALGNVKWFYDWDWRGAQREYQTALEINPNYEMTYRYYGLLFVGLRRFDEAFRMFEKGLRLDPLSAPLNAYFGLAYVSAGEAEKAIEQCRKTLELDPNFLPALGFLSQAFWAKGNYQAAVETSLRQCEIQRVPITLSNLAHVFSYNGQTDEARKILAELEAAKQKVPPIYFALIHIGLGERQKAWKYLEQAFAERSPLFAAWLNSDVRFRDLRDEPRFQKLLRLTGFI